MPVSSRRSMKTRPPWSRRVLAQPASVSALALVLGDGARRSGDRASDSSGERSGELAEVDAPVVRPPLAHASRRPAPTNTVARAPSRLACVSWPLRERPA